MVPRVAVLSTGGTIASTAGEGGATPTKGGEELLDAVPELAEYADVAVEQVAQVPSFDLDFETVLDLAAAARDAATNADGIVVTHGTDTMEESAYALDLLLDLDAPVVFTGAQRRPDERGSDGPANLRDAVRAAAHERLRGAGGVYVAFDEELHAAREVRKLHASRLGTFASPDAGPVVTFDRDGVRIRRAPGSRSAHLPVDGVSARVEIVPSAIGVTGRQVELAVEDGADGLVVEGTGLGNATAALGEAVADAVDAGVSVVMTTRCPAGAAAPVYGTPGGHETLAARGVTNGGDLSAAKARVKLTLALSQGDDPAAAFGESARRDPLRTAGR